MSMPPPVTKDSSKKDLFDEIIALREEVENQQEHLNKSRVMLERFKNENLMLSYQLRCIREVMSMEFKA